MSPTKPTEKIEETKQDKAPPPAAAPAAAKKPAPAPAAAKKPAPAAKAQGSTVLALAKAMIMKSVNQKPIASTTSTMAFVSTGSIIVDWLIGGSPAKDGKGPVCPGFPRRKITEVYGAESSGKTTLCLSAMADVQRRGGTVMFLDFEHALHRGYAETLGVSFAEDKMLNYQPDTLEEGFKMMLIGIMTGVDLIVVDSVAAMVPAAELEKDPGDTAKVGGVAKPMAENLPKFALWLMKYPMDKTTKKPLPDKPGTALVFINQTRANISTGGGGGGQPQDNTSGGKALKFFSYVRLQLQRVGSEYIEKKDPMSGKMRRFPYGNQTKVKCVKSKCDAKQGHEVEIFIRYGYGIDNYYSAIQTGQAQNIIKKDGSWLTYGGERYQGRDKFRQALMDNRKLFDQLVKQVNDAVLSTAEQAVADEELSEEDQLLAEAARELGLDDDEADLGGPVAETVISEGESG